MPLIEQIIANRTAPCYSTSSGYTSITAGTTRTKHFVSNVCEGLRLSFFSVQGGYGGAVNGGEINFTNDFEIKCSIELSNGKIFPLFFNGKRLKLVKPGSLVNSDLIMLPFSKNDVVWIRTFCNRIKSDTYAIANGEYGALNWDKTDWPKNVDIRGVSFGSGEGVYYSSSTGINPFNYDYTDSGTIPSGDSSGFMPHAILGLAEVENCKGVAVIGDSIAAGAGDNSSSIDRNGAGFIRRALGDSVPNVMLAQGGERLVDWNINGEARLRPILAAKCKFAIINLGSNDLMSNVTFSFIQKEMLTLWSRLTKMGLKVYQCTILPRTTSSDATWKTDYGQTTLNTYNFNHLRVEINNWIRTCPSPLAGFFDAADKVETCKNSGIWRFPNESDSGTLTAGTNISFTDTSKNWPTNILRGKLIKNITNNRISRISFNSNNTATLGTALDLVNNVGDSYEIVDSYTYDGVHPTIRGHIEAAKSIDISVLM